MVESLRGRIAYAPLVVVLAILFLPTCGGGGGGGGAPPAPIPLDLGVLSATTPSAVGRTFLNPLGVPATVTSPALMSPFFIDPADLPPQVLGGGPMNVPIRFQPNGPGPQSGPLILRFGSGGTVVEQTFEVTATGEAIPWTVTPTPVAFGDVLPNGERELEIEVGNDSVRSPVTFTAAQFTSTAYTFVQDPFPLTVLPFQTKRIRVRFAPSTIASHDALLRLGANDVGGPLDIPLRGLSSGNGEEIIDLGGQPLTNGETPLLSVDIPDTAIGVTFEGVMPNGNQVGLLSLEGPGAKIYEDPAAPGAVVRWVPSARAFALHLPSSNETATQLVAGGGTYRFRLQRTSGASPAMDVRVIIEHRVGPAPTALLPLNVFLADGLTPNAATAATDANLQSTLTQVGQILGAQGVSLGDITYYDVTDATLDAIAQGEETVLFEQGGVAQDLRLNLFLVKSVWAGQLLGFSGSIDGAKRIGDSVAGVVSFYFDAQPGAIAAIIAHEICHYLGLWHTVEADGTYDPITDTPECPVVGTSAACAVEGGDLLMHWQGNGGKVLSPGQGLVIRSHAFLHPPAANGNALVARPPAWQPDAATLEYLQTLPLGWCGTGR